MSSYTCISCRVAFSDGEVQRAHYKTDWHRYNLKRKVAEMPPVTAENFQERVLAQRAAADLQLSAAAAGEFCATCSKKFNTANAYRNHLQSHRHQQVEKQALLAAQRKVEKMNEKNLEKGLSGGEAEDEDEDEEEEEEEGRTDHDAKNQALRNALKEQRHRAGPPAPARTQASSSSSTGLQEAKEGAEERRRAEKAPRMVWLEEQARRMETKDKEEQEDAAAAAAAADDEEWEDVDNGEEDDDDDDDDDMEEDEEPGEWMEQGESSSSPSADRPDILPGAIAVTDCLFCSHHSRTLVKNVAHMTKVHSFFLPDVEFLVDLRGMIRYLAEKVGAGNVCLWCNEKGRSFYSTKAVQGHMVDKSHCKLFTDGDAALEFADFYDFRSTYPDRKEGEDADMEDEGLPDEKNLEYDEETDYLTLPSGARIGHRSLMRYYKQRFGVQRTVAVRTNRSAVGRVLKQYRALGWAGDMGSCSVYRQQKDMQFVQRMKSKWMVRMGMNHNKTKQHHFRAQVMF